MNSEVTDDNKVYEIDNRDRWQTRVRNTRHCSSLGKNILDVPDWCRVGYAPIWQFFGAAINLLDMIRIDGTKLYTLARTLAQLETSLNVLPASPVDSQPLEDNARHVQSERFKRYRRVLKSCGLRVTVKSADRTLKELNDPRFNADSLTRALRELHNCITYEIGDISFWRIEYPDFLAKDGLNLNNKFEVAHKDAEEAGKCLAFDRNTAAVFHLMRVMEVGLRALGKSLNDPSLDPQRNPNWETILRKCDNELKKEYADRTPEWNSDAPFFSTATANLRAVKDAWRNSTLHIDRYYDGEEAREVWNAVKAFMRHLSLKLG